jgi:[ribosomal protein S5]-alanine N-acetyltransferase
MLVTPLETPRLIIRDVRVTDADAFHTYMRLEQYWRDLPIQAPTPGSIAKLVDRCLEDQVKVPRSDFFLAATDKTSGQLIGEAILHVRSIQWLQGEIGWGVAPDRVGRGFGTEIGEALLRHAFDTHGLHRVYARCRVENQASRRIMVKLGMREEGVFREDIFARGAWWSTAQYSKLSGDEKPSAT